MYLQDIFGYYSFGIHFDNQRIDVIECYLIYQDTLREGKIAFFAKILKIQICHLNQFTIAGQNTSVANATAKALVNILIL